MSITVTFMPDNKCVQVKKGTTVMQAAQKAGVYIRSRCGHQAGCLMCKISVDSDHNVMQKTEKEQRKLGDGHIRLACQTKILRDVVVQLPEDPLKKAVRAQLKQLQKGEELW